MTTAKELNDLVDLVEQRSAGWIDDVNRSAIIAALRLAATLEEFGELDYPTLWRRTGTGTWVAYVNIAGSPSTEGPTPIEAMRAAIDYALSSNRWRCERHPEHTAGHGTPPCEGAPSWPADGNVTRWVIDGLVYQRNQAWESLNDGIRDNCPCYDRGAPDCTCPKWGEAIHD